jgi:hypothetical protein
MRSRRPKSFGGLLGGLLAALMAIGATNAQAAGFGVSLWEAGTCVNSTCTYASVEKNHAEAFTHVAGHAPFGLTTFELNSKETLLKQKEPEGAPLRRVRVDVPAGLASNPQAPVKCSIKAFKKDECPAETEVGENELEVFAKATDTKVTGHVYNLEPELGEEGLGGLPLLFGIHVEIPAVLNEHVFLKGYVAWWSDYHEFFEINNISETKEKAEIAPVLKSKLIFKGTKEGAGAYGDFITLPSECSSTTTSDLELESWTGQIAREATHTPVGVEDCEEAAFEPTAEVTPETAQSDVPDGATTEVKVPQRRGASEINTPDVKDAHVTLPEGLTLNSAAARGLSACTPAQIAIGTMKPVECPASSKIGEVTIEADLPEKSLSGNVYLGGPETGLITKPPYVIYVDAESARFGVSVRLKGLVSPNPLTGRLETTFLENPQQPFSDFIFKAKGGPQAPLANPLVCGSSKLEALFTPYTGLAPALPSSPFTTIGCPSPLPFSLSQSTSDQPANAGAFGNTAYTFNLMRPDGQQYLAKVATTLPAGLVGAIPNATLCEEPQAAQGTCPTASQIGTATVTVGAGPEPYPLSAPVFLTGPYGGGPFGLSIPVHAAAGPFDFGTILTRAAITIDPYSARVSVTSSPLPTIVQGVPVRLKSVSVNVNRANFLYNPTNCGALATETTVTSTFGVAQPLSPSPFAVANCGALPLTPSFTAASSANTSKLNGASLQVNVTQPAHQANIRSVVTSLPPQLVSRLTTLQQACPEATYAVDPSRCPAGADVGLATATTPVLPGTLSGPAILVSHGGAAFPDLDILLEGAGVRTILVGNTDIKNGVTTSTFATLPDVPVSSFSLVLPTGPHSLLTTNGSVCAQPLLMPTTITGQNGLQIKQSTRISVAGCPPGASASKCLKIGKRTLVRHVLKLTVRVCAAGRISARGRYMTRASRKLRRASTTTLKLALTRAGVRAVHRHHPLRIRVVLSFVPQHRGAARAGASTSVAFRR